MSFRLDRFGDYDREKAKYMSDKTPGSQDVGKLEEDPGGWKV